MKTINFFLKILSAAVIMLLINPADTVAQNQPSKTPSKMEKSQTKKKTVTPDARPSITYCDDLISATFAELEARANKGCSATKQTIQCTDKRSGKAIYVTLVAKPAVESCGTKVSVSFAPDDRGPKSRGATMETEDTKPNSSDATFDVEVMERQLPDGRVHLSAYIPGDNDVEEKYEFSWSSADKREVDSDREIEITDEKEISLTVTDKSTRASVTKNISLLKTMDKSRN